MDILIENKRVAGIRKTGKTVPAMDDDTLMSKEDFFAKIDHSLQQAREGKIAKTVRTREELTVYLDSL
jgi:hypothetical protein